MIAIIGCGNPNRRDDGAGPEVVRMLRERGMAENIPDVRLFDTGTDGMAVMFAARGCKTLIIVDASRTGSPPGAIFAVPGAELERKHEPSLNLHDFSWEHALFAGRQIFRDAFPKDVTVFLIEVEDITLGSGLSPAVASAAIQVADDIETLARSRSTVVEPAS